MTLSLTDPIVLKGGAGLALYAFGGSRFARLGGIALAAWAAWDYYQATTKPAPKMLVPYDPDAPLPLQAAATAAAPASRSPADPFYGTKWPTGYTPSIRPARPGEQTGSPGKVIPLHPPTPEERAAFYGVDEDEDDNHG